MGVTPVRVFNSIKIGGVGGVANNPVVIWPLRFHLADSSLGKIRTFLLIFDQNALSGTLHYCLLHDCRYHPRLI